MEISSKGGLVRVIEVAKQGRIKAFTHIFENELRLGEILGTGTFAEVKRATWQDKVSGYFYFHYFISFHFILLYRLLHNSPYTVLIFLAICLFKINFVFFFAASGS